MPTDPIQPNTRVDLYPRPTLMRESSCKARYHERDTRVEATAVATLRDQVSSVACIVPSNRLISHRGRFPWKKCYKLLSHPLKKVIKKIYNRSLAKDVKFRKQRAPGSATAFLVGPNILLTAAHCVCKDKSDELDRDKIDNQRIIFDFKVNGTKTKTHYKANEIYRIKHVIKHQFIRSNDKFADWALVLLDKEVEGRTPIQLRKEKLSENVELSMLGHPLGLPMKAALDGRCVRIDPKGYFESDISAYHGNSGSPVFEKGKQEACGILVSGNEDLEIKGKKVYDHLVSNEEINMFGYEKIQCITDDILDALNNAKLIDQLNARFNAR